MPDLSPVELATVFADIERQLSASAETMNAFDALTRIAVERVPGAELAGITRGRHGTFETLGPTAPSVVAVDRVQYEMRSGPCVDAILEETVFLTGDLPGDRRWPEFGRRANEIAGINSMMSFRMFVEGEVELVAGLNLYSRSPDAFDSDSLTAGLLLTTHGALALQAAMAHEKAENLKYALTTSRVIGAAIGILMATHKITMDEGFDLLRIASQNSHRKLSELAEEVVETGELPALPARRDPAPPRPRTGSAAN